MNEAVDSIVCRTTTDFSLRCFFIYYSTLLDFFFLTVWVGIDLIDISINTENKTLYRSIDTLGTDPSSLITTFKTCKTCSSPTCNQKQVQRLVLQKLKDQFMISCDLCFKIKKHDVLGPCSEPQKKKLATMCVKTSMAASSHFYHLQTDSHKKSDLEQLLQLLSWSTCWENIF